MATVNNNNKSNININTSNNLSVINHNNNNIDASSYSNTTTNPWDIAHSNYTYLVATLSELVYAVGINIKQDTNNNAYAHSLDDDEIALLEDPQVL